jgi:peptidoglycan hydrolase CwlO-like protein
MKKKISVLMVALLLTLSPACAQATSHNKPNLTSNHKIEQPKVGLQDYHPPLKSILLGYLVEIGVKIYRK